MASYKGTALRPWGKINNLLIDLKDKLRLEMCAHVRGSFVSMAMDSGTIHGRTTSAICILHDGQAFTWNVVEMVDGCTASAYNALLGTVVSELKQMHVTVVHIVSGAGSAIKKAVREFTKAGNMIGSLSTAHALQLVMEQVLTLGKKDDILEIASRCPTFRAPVPTRWWSSLNEVQQVIKCSNWNDYTQKGILQEWDKRFEMYQVVGRLLERNDCTIGAALRLWLALTAKAEEGHKVHLNDRLIRVMSAHLLCGVLSPAVKWGTISTSIKKRLHETCVPLVLSLSSDMPSVTHSSIWSEFNSWFLDSCLLDERAMVRSAQGKSAFAGFWGNFVVVDKVPHLAHAAQKVAVACASEAACERLFSSTSFIHSDLRARLRQDLVEAESAIRCRVKSTIDISKVETGETGDNTGCPFFSLLFNDCMSSSEVEQIESLYDAGDMCAHMALTNRPFCVRHNGTTYYNARVVRYGNNQLKEIKCTESQSSNSRQVSLVVASIYGDFTVASYQE